MSARREELRLAPRFRKLGFYHHVFARVSLNDLLQENHIIANALLLEPDRYLPILDEAICAAQQRILPQHPQTEAMVSCPSLLLPFARLLRCSHHT